MRFLAKFSKLKKSLNVKALSKNHVIIKRVKTGKKGKKINVFEALIFLKRYCYCQSKEILWKQHLQMLSLREILHGQNQLL